jgi:hypothetical protein
MHAQERGPIGDLGAVVHRHHHDRAAALTAGDFDGEYVRLRRATGNHPSSIPRDRRRRISETVPPA